MFWVGRSEGDGTMENTTDFFILLKKGGKKITSRAMVLRKKYNSIT